jgi:hypothetical protein
MSQTLQYRGYDGSVLFSAEDRVLHGRILGIRDMVSRALRRPSTSIFPSVKRRVRHRTFLSRGASIFALARSCISRRRCLLKNIIAS